MSQGASTWRHGAQIGMNPSFFWPRLFSQPYDWLQVGVTSYCNAACAYCPHTIYRRDWQQRHLALETFRRLLPDLKRVRLVYLQGWGEPFLHPDFFALVALAKEAGCQVGTTTNATLLTPETIRRIVAAGIDVVALSLAGVGQTHDIWRQGTSYRQVLQAAADLQECKRALGAASPRVHIAYLLLRAGLADLGRLPGELQGTGVEQVVVSTLDFVAAPELERESLALATGSEQAEIRAHLKEAVAAGARRGVAIHVAARPARGDRPVCPENVLKAAVLSPTGGVSPCVFTNVPARRGDYYVRGARRPFSPLCFGQVHDLSFRQIWQQPAYREFRRSWRSGVLAEPCRHCLKIME